MIAIQGAGADVARRVHATSVDDRALERRAVRRPWLPLVIAIAWMLGTFGLFWTGSLAQQVPNRVRLCLFVLGATGAFAVGYAVRARGRPSPATAGSFTPIDERQIGRLVLAGAAYYFVYGLALLDEYGASGLGSIWASLQDPARAYLSKFAVYQAQQDTGRTNLALQALTLLGVLGAVLVPLLVIRWRRLSPGLRLAGLAGLAVYALFFLYIGTLKGLGDLVIMTLASLMVASVTNPGRHRTARRRSAKVLGAVLLAAFCAYMVTSQADRVTLFGTEDRIVPNPAVERVVGTHLATGVAAFVIYPTHGYLGLAYNLDTPFRWSYGLGSAPAARSYAVQYLGVDPDEHPPYPVRTEDRTGWPAGLYWATIYPWLASDLTFPGTLLFMALVGWFFAHTWRRASEERQILPTLIFVQLSLLVAYIPANNQLGMSRPSLLGIATLLALYAASAVKRGYQRRDRKTSGPTELNRVR